MNSIKRTQTKMFDVIASVQQTQLAEREDRAQTRALCDGIRTELKLLNFNSKMEKTCNLSKILPFDDQDSIMKFLDDSDGLLDTRTKSLYNEIFNIVTNDPKKFADQIINLLFTRNYIASHHWPCVV